MLRYTIIIIIMIIVIVTDDCDKGTEGEKLLQEEVGAGTHGFRVGMSMM